MEQFKIGERVQFKSWEEMEKEFGLDGCGNIRCKCIFSTHMRHLCGAFATVSLIREEGKIKLCDFSVDDSQGDWIWKYSTDMIKKIKRDNMKAKIIYNGKEAEIEITDEIEKLFGMNKSKQIGFENGDVYYYLADDGEVDSDKWDGSELDTNRLARRNAFCTQEGAQFKADKDLLIAEMETFAEENNGEIDWNDLCQDKYYIYIDYCDNELEIGTDCSIRDTFQIYFSSEEIAQKAINKFGERIKKYLFNIN